MFEYQDIQKIQNILGLPRDIQFTKKDIENLLFPNGGYKIKTKLGAGDFGIVFSAATTTRPKSYIAVKLMKYLDNIEDLNREIQIQEIFTKHKMAPKIHSVDILESVVELYEVKFIVIKMEMIYYSVLDYLHLGGKPKRLIPAMECLIKKKILLKILHGDMHPGNIVILSDKKTLGFIDFIWSRQNQTYTHQILDSIPLITFLKTLDTKITGVNTLIRGILDIYKRIFNTNMNYEYFKKHPLPENGYVYMKDSNNIQDYLHSYDWKQHSGRRPLPSEEEINNYLQKRDT